MSSKEPNNTSAITQPQSDGESSSCDKKMANSSITTIVSTRWPAFLSASSSDSNIDYSKRDNFQWIIEDDSLNNINTAVIKGPRGSIITTMGKEVVEENSKLGPHLYSPRNSTITTITEEEETQGPHLYSPRSSTNTATMGKGVAEEKSKLKQKQEKAERTRGTREKPFRTGVEPKSDQEMKLKEKRNNKVLVKKRGCLQHDQDFIDEDRMKHCFKTLENALGVMEKEAEINKQKAEEKAKNALNNIKIYQQRLQQCFHSTKEVNENRICKLEEELKKILHQLSESEYTADRFRIELQAVIERYQQGEEEEEVKSAQEEVEIAQEEAKTTQAELQHFKVQALKAEEDLKLSREKAKEDNEVMEMRAKIAEKQLLQLEEKMRFLTNRRYQQSEEGAKSVQEEVKIAQEEAKTAQEELQYFKAQALKAEENLKLSREKAKEDNEVMEMRAKIAEKQLLQLEEKMRFVTNRRYQQGEEKANFTQAEFQYFKALALKAEEDLKLSRERAKEDIEAMEMRAKIAEKQLLQLEEKVRFKNELQAVTKQIYQRGEKEKAKSAQTELQQFKVRALKAEEDLKLSKEKAKEDIEAMEIRAKTAEKQLLQSEEEVKKLARYLESEKNALDKSEAELQHYKTWVLITEEFFKEKAQEKIEAMKVRAETAEEQLLQSEKKVNQLERTIRERSMHFEKVLRETIARADLAEKDLVASKKIELVLNKKICEQSHEIRKAEKLLCALRQQSKIMELQMLEAAAKESSVKKSLEEQTTRSFVCKGCNRSCLAELQVQGRDKQSEAKAEKWHESEGQDVKVQGITDKTDFNEQQKMDALEHSLRSCQKLFVKNIQDLEEKKESFQDTTMNDYNQNKSSMTKDVNFSRGSDKNNRVQEKTSENFMHSKGAEKQTRLLSPRMKPGLYSAYLDIMKSGKESDAAYEWREKERGQSVQQSIDKPKQELKTIVKTENKFPLKQSKNAILEEEFKPRASMLKVPCVVKKEDSIKDICKATSHICNQIKALDTHIQEQLDIQEDLMMRTENLLNTNETVLYQQLEGGRLATDHRRHRTLCEGEKYFPRRLTDDFDWTEEKRRIEEAKLRLGQVTCIRKSIHHKKNWQQ